MATTVEAAKQVWLQDGIPVMDDSIVLFNHKLEGSLCQVRFFVMWLRICMILNLMTSHGNAFSRSLSNEFLPSCIA